MDYFMRFVKEEKPKKQIKPEVKEKYKILFKKILTLKPQEKKNLFLKILEQQLVQSYGHLFQKDDEEQNNLQIKPESNGKISFEDQQDKQKQIENSIQQQNQLKEISIISSPPLYQDMGINQPKVKEIKSMEMVKLESQFNQQGNKDEFSNRNSNFDSNLRLFNLQKQFISSENKQTPNKNLQNQTINEVMSKVNFKGIKFSKILISIYLALRIASSQKCPQLQTFHNPMAASGYAARNVIRIPKTNILIINTLYEQYQDSSIVYYYDLSSISGETINVIKPDYVIIDMKYNSQTDQLVVSNFETLIFADPYTLKALVSYSIPKLSAIMILEQTNYILLTNFYNHLQIFDFLQQKVLLNMDNTKQLTAQYGSTQLYQFKSILYQLSTGDKIIITSNDAGLISWGIDLQNLTYQFYGFIPNSQVNLDAIHRSFTKHPIDDVIFIGGNSTQIIAVKILDIKNSKYQLLYNTSLMNVNSVITNLLFVNLSKNKYQLWAGDGVNIYQVYLKGSSYTINKFYYYQADTFYDWYLVQESQSIIICSKFYLTTFNFTSYKQTYFLYFYHNIYARRFIWQNDGYNDIFALLSENQLNLYDRGNFGYTSQYSTKPYLQKFIRFKYGSFYTIKMLNGTCFYKGTNDGSDKGNSYIGMFPIFPFSQGDTIIDITSIYNLQWPSINQNLDPFFLNNNIWVAFAFPSKASTENYLFQLINCNSTNQRIYLKSNLTTDNQVKTAFAVASLENKNNLELIGVDNLGTVYSWDLSQQGFPFKFFINFSLCKNSVIGDIFHYDTQKRLILSCDIQQIRGIIAGQPIQRTIKPKIQLNENHQNFEKILNIAQYYQQMINGVSNMGVDILIQPGSILDLNSNFMNFDFNSIISLNFKSTIQGNPASLLNVNTLVLQNYNQIGFQDIIIYFGQSSPQNQCGISVQNIKQGVTFDNIQLYLQFQVSDIKSCQVIQADSTQISILKYEIQNEDFTNHQSIISSFNATQIIIQNMTIANSKLGLNFSVLKQLSNLNAYISNLEISGNTCSQDSSDDQSISQLFQAGYFVVKNVNITNNIFCKKVIFQVESFQNQEFKSFSLQNIDMKNNKFQARTQYIFFSAIYSMIVVPYHELNLYNINFYNNTLFKLNLNDLSSSQYFQTNKIGSIQIEQTTIQNHFDIQLALIEFVNSVYINNFQCFNDQLYLSQIPNQLAIGCLEMNEVQNITFFNLQTINKKVQDSSIIVIKNKFTQSAKFNMTKGNFTNVFLSQTGVNTESTPIYIVSDYQIEITLDSCVFQNIFLNSVPFTITISSTALFVQNYVGSVLIKNTQFYNSYSNSNYGFIFIQANTFILDTVQFNNSTFPIDKSLSMFNSEGGMINVKAQVVNISNCNFSKSTSSYGAFIYFESFSQVLNINIISTSFSEGYALNDGSAFFIDTFGQQLNFNCQNCEFNNLYTFQSQASTIGIEKYIKTKSKNQSIVSFYGGQIVNTYGDIDNYFLDVINYNIQFSGKQRILSEDFSSTSLAHLFFKAQNNNNYQYATLLNIKDSNLSMQDCYFQNIYITSSLSNFPLLLSSTNSSVQIQNTQIFDSSFVTSALSLIQSNVLLSQVTFTNVNQEISNRRIIQQAESQISFINTNQTILQKRVMEEQINPSLYSHSLIISYQSRLNINQNSNFTSINCNTNCNGGAIQAVQSTLNIQNTLFKQIKSTFGGAVFIYGINNTNIIQNTQFQYCQAQNDGGGIYLFALQNDKFKLNISESLLENNSCGQRGGGIFIYSETLNSPNQQIKLQNSQIIRNKASVGGGIFLQNLSADVQQQNIISSNTATTYGSDQSSYPTKLRISNINQFLQENNGKVNKEQLEVHNFRSGANLTSIEFQFLNQKNEIIIPITPEEEEQFQINVQFDIKSQNLQSYIASGQTFTKYDPKLQSFAFNYINLVGLPGTTAFLQFSSPQIYSVDPQSGQFIQNYSFNILINFRNCGPGEQINKVGQVKECQICPENFYSFNVENCKACPDGAECHGSTNLITKLGYWRRSNDSDIILKCSNLLKNCNGGSYGDNICYEGHIGALCEECDIYGEYWSQTYSKSSKFSCTRCDQIQGNIWIVSLMTIWTLISMVLAIKGNIEILQEKAAALVLQKNLRGRKKLYQNLQRNDKNKSTNIYLSSTLKNKNQMQYQSQPTSDQEKSGVFIKMLTNYIQIVGSIATFNLSIPSGIFEFPQSVGQPLKQTMNSLDCALEGFSTQIPIIYMRLLFSLLIPIIYMFLFLFCMAIYHFLKKLMTICQKKEIKNYYFPWYIMTTAIIFLIIYVQPDLVAQIIALLSCRQIGDTKYILSNVSFVCYTEQHFYYAFVLLLPLLLMWVVILPLILFLALKRNKKNLESIQIKLKYGFLYKEYQNYAYYWEFVKMAVKLVIILALNFYSQSIVTKGVLVFIVITAYGILSLIIHPYQESDINEIDVNSTNVCALTVLLGIFIYNNPFDYFVYSSFAIIAIVNFFLLITKYIQSFLTIENQFGHYLRSSEEFQLLEQYQGNKIQRYSEKQMRSQNEEDFINNQNDDQNNQKYIPTIQLDTLQNFNNFNTETAIQYETKDVGTSRLRQQQSNQQLIQFHSSTSIQNQKSSNNQNLNNGNTSIQLTNYSQQNKTKMTKQQKMHKNVQIESNNPTNYEKNEQDIIIFSLDDLDAQNNFQSEFFSEQQNENKKQISSKQSNLEKQSNEESLYQDPNSIQQIASSTVNYQEIAINQLETINNLENKQKNSQISIIENKITQNIQEVIQFSEEDSIYNQDQYDEQIQNNSKQSQKEIEDKINIQNNGNCDLEYKKCQSQFEDDIVNKDLIQFSQNEINFQQNQQDQKDIVENF
ncbi:transmembrane protein, putative (macronuclear) [Tetrahymena thermophila SB210]|uniref:Transmembrane protein, putative n=1 Tax=Tetrahymena thermophila (strain SB210) TaxID=312017 RepID=W7XDF5_TETTS|nr:transmembrane protein, putative [Tetrahymena thermophila SB210]EWS75587.1 transmembrane protein, putative [Tetrahymena thermophila SB210]|eukprot:XP_012651887.1 transmembrane protein, putative [Tetrahymena thermophila SB210]